VVAGEDGPLLMHAGASSHRQTHGRRPEAPQRRKVPMNRKNKPVHARGCLLAVAVASMLPLAALAQTVERQADGVIVRPADASAADVRLQVVGERIVRVSADPDGDFKRSPSLMRSTSATSVPAFKIEQDDDAVRLQAAGISAQVALADGQVSFFDAAGKPLLAETAGARTFEAVEFEGTPYYSLRQRFQSQGDEAFYGTGLHQQGWMNLKGRDVELLQHNIDNAIPYLVSSRNYGILWDNNAITRYGDPRGLRQIGEAVALYDKDGVEGALTATYSIDGEVKLVRREAKIDYQFISGLEDFPEEGKNMAPGGRSDVVWEGKIAARSDGRHTFSLYNSEYARLYVDGKLVIDRWRQNWNPWHHEFALDLKAGHKHDLRIEWDRIEPAYLALQGRDPLPAAEA